MTAEKRNLFMFFLLLFGLLCLCTSNAAAVPITLTGDNVIFTYDDSNLGLFGTPKVSGDTLYFEPTNFKAESVNGSGFSLTSSTIHINIQTIFNDVFFGNLSLFESGDYLMLGSGGSVGVAGALIATNNSDPLGAYVFAPIVSSSDLDNTGLLNPWEAFANSDLTQKGWNSITATLENILIVSSTLNPSSSSIQKKYEGLEVKVVSVPEPSTLLLLCVGIGGLSLFGRKKPVMES